MDASFVRARKRRPRARAAGIKLPKRLRRAGGRDPERTSAVIRAAAVKEFTEKGYGGARIDAIALRSGVNKRLIYHYFGSKEALYLAVLESGYSGIRSAEASLRLPRLSAPPPAAT